MLAECSNRTQHAECHCAKCRWPECRGFQASLSLIEAIDKISENPFGMFGQPPASFAAAPAFIETSQVAMLRLHFFSTDCLEK